MTRIVVFDIVALARRAHKGAGAARQTWAVQLLPQWRIEFFLEHIAAPAFQGKDVYKRQEQLSQIRQNILTLLRQLSNLSTQLFSIEASIGYVVTDDSASSLNDYINRADEEMYLIKKARKAERTRHTD